MRESHAVFPQNRISPTGAYHLAQVLVGLGLVAAPLLRRDLLPLGRELPAPFARVDVGGIVLVEALAREMVPLAAAFALDVVLSACVATYTTGDGMGYLLLVL